MDDTFEKIYCVSVSVIIANCAT